MPIVNPPPSNTPTASNVVVAEFVARPVSLDAHHPAVDWQRAVPVSFCSDWQGRQSDPARQTTVRILWDQETIYLHFDCSYRELFVFPDSDPSGRRDKLWDRDVAEVFLQPDPPAGHYYKEFEVSPNGMWIDLDISPQGLADLKSGMTNTGEYRTTFNLSTVTKIYKAFGWQNSFGDIYVSNPPVGKKKNDIVFSTGLNITFTH